MRNFGKGIAGALLICTGFLWTVSVHAETASAPMAYDLYGTIQSFTWREFDDSGAQLLRESGPLIGVGAVFAFRQEESNLRIRLKGDLFLGQVDYVGQACDPVTCVPASTDTTYFGFQGQGDLGTGIKTGARTELQPFVGAGVRWWVRDIGNAQTALGPSAGYEEYWTSFYLRFGARFEVALEERARSNVYMELAARLPFYNENHVPDFDVILHPRLDPSLTAEIGVRGERLRASFFYEGLRFKKSSPEGSTIGLRLQPDSEGDIYGLSVGMAF